MEATRQEFGERSGAVRLLALGGTVGPALFVATIIVAASCMTGIATLARRSANWEERAPNMRSSRT